MRTLTIDRTKEWTAEDYLMLGETNMPCQLINGELVMSPAPSPYHQIVSSNIFDFLRGYSKEFGGLAFYAPVDLLIDKKNVFQPDIFYLSKEKKDFVTDNGIQGPPDLVIEIISPSNSYTDRYDKKDTYQKFGVIEYWIVDPANKTLEIYNGANWNKPSLYLAEEGRVTSTTLVQLQFDLKEVFKQS